MDLLFPETPGARASAGLLAVRIVAGIAFMHHGWGKIQNPFGWMGADSGFPGWLLALAALSEFGGGLAWVIGLLTPLASFGILCTMAVAVAKHLSMGASFVGGEHPYEPALVYYCVALLLLLAGPGLFALDTFVFGARRPSGWSARR